MLAVQGVDHLPHDPSTGKRRVYGASGLKASQIYPKGYGIELCQLWKQKLPPAGGFPEVDPDTEIPWVEWSKRSSECNWPELHLEDVAAIAGVPQHVIQ